MIDRQAQLLGMEAQKAQSVSGTLKRFGAYFRPYWLPLLIVLAAIIVSTWMQVRIPYLIGQAIDCYLTPYASRVALTGNTAGVTLPPAAAEFFSQMAGDTAAGTNCTYTTIDPTASYQETLAGFTRLMLVMVFLYVGSSVLTGITFYAMSWAGFRVLRDLRDDVFRHIHRLSLGYFSKHEAGDVMSRLTNDMDTIQQMIGFGVVQVVQGVLLIVWIIYVMFRDNVPFALISLVTLPLMLIFTKWFSDQARKAFRQARKEIGSVNADLQEGISGVREVQAFSREAENIEQFRTNNAANRDANIKAQAYTSALAPTLEALSYVSLAIVACVGGIAILRGGSLMGSAVSLGLIFAFIQYTQRFNMPVQQIALLWTNIQSAIAGGERIFGLLDEVPELTDKPDAMDMPAIEGDVRFEQVWAAYNPGEPVLKGVDIHGRPGETIAIVGPTGAGKTTIINLLPRFWDVTDGRILIDGRDIRDVTRDSLRQQIGIVLQDAFLFSDTVLNNIRYAKPDATDEEVMAAAKLARAHDFIERLGEGYQTVLGERGGGLSQGQRQLIAIARVALSDPRILILDEATSSVDTRTEREIQKAFAVLLHGRTSFVIAHRLSTIRSADQVLVLNHGEIIERGTHRELLAARGFYYDLYMSQFRRQLDAGESDEELAEEVDAFFAPAD
ncbi:MAG: ABC transporter ATP-binding protein/permease [Anaerolineae bacterium]|nr:ABC transporter ATP-binding protein/permease [Anaerolineae bacterium]